MLERDAVPSGHVPEHMGCVVLPVVGEDALDPDALPVEVSQRAIQEVGGGDALLIGQRLHIGVARVVVDGDVPVIDPHPTLRMRPCTGLREPRSEALAPARWDAAQLLHVQVEQLARMLALVAHDLSCGSMEPCQTVQVQPSQAGLDRRAGGAQRPADAVRPPPLLASDGADRLDQRRAG